MANCILCTKKLNFFYTPTPGTGKLKDGGIVCLRCCKYIDAATFLKLHLYTLSELKKILEEKEVEEENRMIDKLLQEKLKTGKMREADWQLLKERTEEEEQKKVDAVIQQIVYGLLRKATLNEQKNDQPVGIAPSLTNYNLTQMKDVFICHASEDKRTFIEPLIAALLSEDISCWYDKAEIKWGDSIVKKVNHGLRNSRFVLVAISMNSIKKNWPNAELEASLNMEFSTGETKVLPLLIGDEGERKTIVDHYPILRSKLYVSYSIGVKEISRLLKERIMIND